MKKKNLTWAGIVAALVLAGMFIGIILTGTPFPFLPPVTTIDPITDSSIDGNNMLTLTGMTNLPAESTYFFFTVNASRPPSQPGTMTENLASFESQFLPEPGGNNRWKGIVNITRLPPADYTVTLFSYTVDERYRMNASHPVATRQFTLGDVNAGAGTVRKKTRVPQTFIRINPAGKDPSITNREISGVTSLAPGTMLAWAMLPLTTGSGSAVQSPGGITTVTPGTAGINRWSVEPGTRAPGPARYRFSIAAPDGNAPSSAPLSAETEIDIPRAPEPPATNGSMQLAREYIAIDALPEIRVNDLCVITGTTSLPAGSDLLFRITPASFQTDYNFSFDPREKTEIAAFSGITGMIPVVNGTSGNNLWSAGFNTYSLIPGRYELTISNNSLDPGTMAEIPGTLSASEIFTATEGIV